MKDRYSHKMATKKRLKKQHMRRWAKNTVGMSWKQFCAVCADDKYAFDYWWTPQKSTQRQALLKYANRKVRYELKRSLRKDFDEIESSDGNYHRKIYDFKWNFY